VDIIVAQKAGDAVTIEVKGTAKKYDWVISNLTSLNPERHSSSSSATRIASAILRCRHLAGG